MKHLHNQSIANPINGELVLANEFARFKDRNYCLSLSNIEDGRDKRDVIAYISHNSSFHQTERDSYTTCFDGYPIEVYRSGADLVVSMGYSIFDDNDIPF